MSFDAEDGPDGVGGAAYESLRRLAWAVAEREIVGDAVRLILWFNGDQLRDGYLSYALEGANKADPDELAFLLLALCWEPEIRSHLDEIERLGDRRAEALRENPPD